MVTSLDSLEYDIKLMLALSPAMRLQWREIFKALHPRYKKDYKTKNSFSVTLHRKLRKLVDASDLDFEERGHQQVFYFIPKKRQKKVMEEIERTSALRRFDAFWDSFSSDQRKRIIRDFAVEQQFFLSFMRNVSSEFLSITQELVEPWISKLENPTEDIKTKYSQKEREQFLREFYDAQKALEKIKADMTRDKQQVITEEEFRTLLSLTQEFMNKVVPKYNGGWREAITDLMRKAVEEQNKRK